MILPKKFYIQPPKVCHPDVLNYLFQTQWYNFSIHLNQLNDHLKYQQEIFHQNQISWLMVLDKEHQEVLTRHIDACFNRSWYKNTFHLDKRIERIKISQVRKKPPEPNIIAPLQTFPFYNSYNSPQKYGLNMFQFAMSSASVMQNFESNRISSDIKDKWLINLTEKSLTKAQDEALRLGFKHAVNDGSCTPLDFYTETEKMLKRIPNDVDRNITRTKVTNMLKKQNLHTTSEGSCQHIEAIRELKKDKRVIVIKADKGNSTVLMKRTEYDQKMLAYLNDETMFEKLVEDPTNTVSKRINKTLDDMHKQQKITSDFKTKSKPLNTNKAPHIFAQIKLHKQDKPLRPIVNTKNHPCNRLSKTLAETLKIFKTTFSYSLNNTTDFINRIKNMTLTNNTKMCSFDIVNMFNSIPHSLAIEAFNYYYNKNKNMISIGKETAITLIGSILNNSYFAFQKNFFRQKRGLAMGSSISPILADMTISYLEEEFLLKHNPKPFLWLRYVDDIFVLWNGTSRQLSTFFTHINNINNNITFTMDFETQESLNFLDLTITRENATLTTKIYHKPTFSGRYLHYSSCHPYNTKLAIPINLFKRVLSYTTKVEEQVKEIDYMNNILKQNGYTQKTLKKALILAKTQATKNTTHTNKGDKWFTLKFVPDISPKIKKLMAKFNVNISFKPVSFLGDFYFGNKHNNSFMEKTGVVYQIECTCGQIYIGETGRTLNTRISEHKRYTQDRYKLTADLKFHSAVAFHALSLTHDINWNNTKILHEEKDTTLRKLVESYYIKTKQPQINIHPGTEIPKQWLHLLKQHLEKRVHSRRQ